MNLNSNFSAAVVIDDTPQVRSRNVARNSARNSAPRRLLAARREETEPGWAAGRAAGSAITPGRVTLSLASIASGAARYGLGWFAGCGRQMLSAWWQLRDCSAVGETVRIEGRVRVRNEGVLKIGDAVRFKSEAAPAFLEVARSGRLDIGAGCIIGAGVAISSARAVKIGRNSIIGSNVTIMDTIFHTPDGPLWNMHASPVVIGDNVTLGDRSVVMKGVSIGDNSVVTSFSIVTCDVPANSLVVGVPGKVIENYVA